MVAEISGAIYECPYAFQNRGIFGAELAVGWGDYRRSRESAIRCRAGSKPAVANRLVL